MMTAASPSASPSDSKDANDTNDNQSSSKMTILLVPQSNLVNSTKSPTSIQYHGQVDKTRSMQLYSEFEGALRTKVLELNAASAAAAVTSAASSSNPGLGESWHDVSHSSSLDGDQETTAGRIVVDLQSGTFGSRQEVTFTSAIGPFCHVFEF
jgi:hypothetical protein